MIVRVYPDGVVGVYERDDVCDTETAGVGLVNLLAVLASEIDRRAGTNDARERILAACVAEVERRGWVP